MLGQVEGEVDIADAVVLLLVGGVAKGLHIVGVLGGVWLIGLVLLGLVVVIVVVVPILLRLLVWVRDELMLGCSQMNQGFWGEMGE